MIAQLTTHPAQPTAREARFEPLNEERTRWAVQTHPDCSAVADLRQEWHLRWDESAEDGDRAHLAVFSTLEEAQAFVNKHLDRIAAGEAVCQERELELRGYGQWLARQEASR